MHQEPLDYNKHCAVPFGTYVQAHNEPNFKNSQHPRTIDCIYLHYVDNLQGGHHLLDLRTGQTIKRRTITQVPITQNIIEMVHKLAEADKMSEGFKITNRNNIALFDSSWIAGVDYEEENDDETSEEDMETSVDNMDPNEIAEMHTKKDNSSSEESNPDESEHTPEKSEHSSEEDNEEEEEDSDEEDHLNNELRTKSGRLVKPPVKLNLNQCHLITQGHERTEYSIETGKVIARNMIGINHKHYQFTETYGLKKGLRKFGKDGYTAALQEMRQLHERTVFKPINIHELTHQEKKRAIDSLIFLVQKDDGRIKARTCANGSVQRDYIDKDEASSPTALTEAIMMTAAIEADENRDVMTADIPNAFVQTEMENKAERIMMKIKGPLAEMLVTIEPEIYSAYIIEEDNQKVIYVQVLKALYGMLQAFLLFYKKLRKDLEEIGFKVNPYDPALPTGLSVEKRQTVTWHVDDLKSSHVNRRVNDEFRKWLDMKYGDDKIGRVRAVRGKRHNYLGMVLDYSTPKKLKLSMKNYIQNMVKEFPEPVEEVKCPWNENLFKTNDDAKQLQKDKAD
jgi:Reverse transcriptase (RNA-dependent DNA polymerase)